MTTQTAPRRPGWQLPAVVGVTIVLAVIAGLLFASMLNQPDGVGQGSPSPTPSASDAPSPEPSDTPDPGPTQTPAPSGTPVVDPAPTPVVEPPEGFLPPGSVARVLTQLRLRSAPTLSAGVIGSIASGELVDASFSFLYEDWGPVQADGYTWYPVRPLGIDELPPLGEEITTAVTTPGWVAAGNGTDTYLELVAPRCTSDEPTLAMLSTMLPWESLACFGDRQLTLEGTYGCGGCGGAFPGTYTPEWLASPMGFDLLSVDVTERVGPFSMRFPPDVERPEPASILRVTGHFDDEAAAACSVAPGEPPVTVLPQVAELYCRERFVVESYEILGVDEDFQFG